LTNFPAELRVDETSVGGRDVGRKKGRGNKRKKIVAIPIEIHASQGFGRVRMRRIPNVSGGNVVAFVCDVVEKGSNFFSS
jgi:hypothetical protein